MLEFSKNYSFITYDKTFFCKSMPYPSSRPEHFHIEVLKNITLTVKYPIDIKVVLRPKGTVKLPLGNNSYSFQNQSAIDSSCDSHDQLKHCNSCNQSKQVLILNKDSITSILLPIGTKLSFTQENNISYHFENITSKQLSITDLNLFINIYEYLTGELSATLSLIARNKLYQLK